MSFMYYELHVEQNYTLRHFETLKFDLHPTQMNFIL